ncbi:MAG: 50S ribosomal protein L9 [Deltaproteobacteria bacterium]|jgi:large subunit ribosomal protein L9|nr:50S ribosomal protein L9 [Deltaproteobacteria bacterium]
MKVILRSDVENLGSLGDLVEVRAGYGRNFLLPQGMAMLATPSNLKVFDLERKKLQARVEAQRREAASLAERIGATRVVIPMRVGENDKLYGSVTSAIIAEALLRQGIDVDRRRILLDSPIRVLGEHTVRIRLHASVLADLPLSVVAEKTLFEAEEAGPVSDDPEQAPTAEESFAE